MPKVEGLKILSESAEQAPEKSTLDPEVMEQLDALGKGINSKEDLLAGLGRVAREKILNEDVEAKKEIFAPREVGRVDLKAEHDAQNFEPAEKRNFLSRFFLKDPKYTMQDKDGLVVDKRKLKPGVKEGAEKGQTKFFPGELEEAAEKLSLTPEEVKAGGFSMDYVEGRSGMEKMLKRAATPEEGDKVAAEILEKQLKEQEQTGAGLAKQRDSLAAFRKEQESIQDMIKPEDLPVLAEKEQSMEKEIQDKQTNIDNYKKDRLPQLQEHKNLTEEALKYSSGKLAEATMEENKFGKEVEGIEEKIKRLKSAKQMLALFGDKIVEFEEQKAKAKLHKQAFIDAEQTLRQNISTFNRNKVEVDKVLERINKIGKTKEELRTEEQIKREEKAKAEQERRRSESPEQTKGAVASTEPAGDEVRIKRGKIDVPEASTLVIQAGEEDSAISDDLINQEVRWRKAEEERKRVLDEEMLTTSRRKAAKTKPEVEQRTEAAIPPAAGAASVESRPGEKADEEGRMVEKKETRIVRPVRFWLNSIFGGVLKEPIHDKIIRKHFRLGGTFDKFKNMTPSQAETALKGFQMDAEGFLLYDSKREAKRKIKEIVENIDKYDREEEEAAALKQKNPAPGEATGAAAVDWSEEATGEDIIPGLANEFGKAIARDWDKNIKGGDAPAAEASASAQDQSEATGGKKPEGKKEKKSPDGGRSNRNLIKRQLAEADLKKDQTQSAAEFGQTKGSRKKKGPSLKTIIENSPINGVASALEQALAQAEKKAEKSADTAKSAEMNQESATKSEQSAEERARMELLAEAVREELKDGKSNGRVERVIKRNFGSAKKLLVMETEDQLVKAIVGYMMDMGNGNREAAETVARAKLEAIKQKIKL